MSSSGTQAPTMRPLTGAPSSSTGSTASLVVRGGLFAVISSILFAVVWLYGNGLRDPRYLDGWILAGGMGLQVCFHIVQKVFRISPKSALSWRRFHVFVGFLLMATFVVHSDFSLPDTGFEWILWIGFVAVVLSGVFGICLAWMLKTKRQFDETMTYERIPAYRDELAREVDDIVAINSNSASAGLPGLPHDGWIQDLYVNHLQRYFSDERHYTAYLLGSQVELTRLTNEIDELSRYVDKPNREKLWAIKDLVLEKDRMDFTRLYLGLNRAWLSVHGPVTYMLVVLTVLHVVVVYAFSSGAW